VRPIRRGCDRVHEWVTREHPKVDHVSCPWLVQRFILEAVLDGRRVMHFADDQAQREASIPVLDALYAYCKQKTAS